jgi:hypothetical protein
MSAALDALRRQGIPILMAVGEADAFIAHLARKLDAVVLSRDSDFFIHRVPCYVNLGHLAFVEAVVVGVEEEAADAEEADHPGGRRRGLSVLAYSAEDVATLLGIPQEAIMLFACFLGCDYVSAVDQALLNTLHAALHRKRGNPRRIQEFARVVRDACAAFLPPGPEPATEAEVLEALLQALRIRDSPTGERVRSILHQALLQYRHVEQEPAPERAAVHALCQAGQLHPKLLSLCFQSVFMCALFNEDCYGSPSAWTPSNGVREHLYLVAARRYGCARGHTLEHVRNGHDMVRRKVALSSPYTPGWGEAEGIPFFLQALASAGPECGVEAGGQGAMLLHALPPWLLLPVLVMRAFLVHQHQRRRHVASPTSNVVVFAHLASCILSTLPSPPTPSRLPRHPATPTAESVHTTAELEGLAFSALFLWQLMGPSQVGGLGLEEGDFWSFDPALFSACAAACKQVGWQELLPLPKQQAAFLQAQAAILQGLEGCVDVVVRFEA